MTISKSNKLIAFYPMMLMLSYWVMTKAGLPIIGSMSQYFNVSVSDIQGVLSLALIIAGISPLLFGPIIDGIGLKKFLIASILVSMVITSIIFFTNNVLIFAVTYIVATVLIFSQAICARSFPFIFFGSIDLKEKAISYTFLGTYASAFFVPFISGWIGYYAGWKSVYLLTEFYLLFLLICIKSLPSDEQAKKNIEFFPKLKAMFKHLKTPGFLTNALFSALLNGVAWTYIISLPFWFAEEYTISSKYLSLYLFPLIIPGLLCPFILQILKKYFTKSQIIGLSLIAFILGGLSAIVCYFLGSHIYAYYYVIPGVILNLASTMSFSLVGTKVFTNIKENFNSAAGMFSLITYVFFGLCVYIESFISIRSFYLEGLFVLIVSVMLSILYFIINYLPSLKKLSKNKCL